jgi:glycosyltransferase involved in cell wall biosynthesis
MPDARRALVLVVLDSLVPGGAERSTVATLSPLIERGFDIEMAVLHDRPGLHGEVRSAGVAIHDLSGPSGRLGWTWRLRSLLRQRRPDLVHTSLFEADICGRSAARSLGVPVVSTLTTEHYGAAHLDTAAPRQAKIRASQLVDGATARFAWRLHAVSSHVADTMARHLRYPRHRIDVVYRGRPDGMAGLDRQHVRTRTREVLGVSGQPVVLSVARHERAKGLDRLIDAFPHVLQHAPDAVLLVAGRDGEQTPALRQATGRLGLDGAVRFLGHRDDITELHAASDVFVLPSRREGLPGSLLEAMAAGTPAVVNDLPQVGEVVSAETAIVVDVADPAALGGAVAAVLADPGRAAARAAAARRRFLACFTLDRSADGMAEFYRRVLDRDRPARSDRLLETEG